MWELTVAAYIVAVAVLTALVARHKGRDTVIWFVGGFAGVLGAVFELGLVVEEDQVDGADGAVALFGDDQFGETL